MNDEERAYNIEDFAAAGSTPTNPGETMVAKVGVMAPEFEAPTLDGATIRLSNFRGKRHLVFMTGAVTSPMCAFEVLAFNQLQRELIIAAFLFFCCTQENRIRRKIFRLIAHGSRRLRMRVS